MTPDLWHLHHWHQLDAAYPHGPMTSPTCHIDTAAPFLRQAIGGNVLIIGPGTFHEVEAIQRVLHPEKITCLTMFGPEIEPLRAKLLEGNEVHAGDMHDMPFPTGEFDLIFSSNVIEHAMSPYIALMECRRVLVDGGTFYAVVPEFNSEGGGHTPYHLYCFEKPFWHELMRKCGLAVNLCETRAQPEIGPRETYLHIRATAVALPEPHDQAMKKLIAYKDK